MTDVANMPSWMPMAKRGEIVDVIVHDDCIESIPCYHTVDIVIRKPQDGVHMKISLGELESGHVVELLKYAGMPRNKHLEDSNSDADMAVELFDD